VLLGMAIIKRVGHILRVYSMSIFMARIPARPYLGLSVDLEME